MMAIEAFPDLTGYAPASEAWHAYDTATYCGCPDCHCPVGTGATAEEAIADLLEIMLDEGEITEDEFRDAQRIHGTHHTLDPDRLREDRDDRLEAL